MQLEAIQAIVFDTRCSTQVSAPVPSCEEYLQRYLQPLFRESLERLSSLNYTLFWLQDKESSVPLFLDKLQLLHFFKKIYTLKKTSLPDESDFEAMLSTVGYKPSQLLYLCFEMGPAYVRAKQLGLYCILFRERQEALPSRACVPKLYDLVPLLLKSKQATPLYNTQQRASVMNSLVGISTLKPFVYERRTKALGSLIDKLLQHASSSNVHLEQAILGAWQDIVGEKLAAQCRPGRIVKDKHLVVVAYNAIIKQELHFKTQSILKKLQGLAGGEQLCALSIQQRG